jgi:hypothetical protein
MMMLVLAVPLVGGSFFLGSPVVVVVVVFPDISLYFESSFTNK